MDQARHDGVEADAPRGIQDGGGLCEGDDGRLGRVVGDLRLADVAVGGDGGEADDAASSAGVHVREEGVAEEVDGFEVHVDLGVPDGFGHGGRRAGLREPDVVDQDVDLAVGREAGGD